MSENKESDDSKTIIARHITVQGDKEWCGHCEEADRELKSKKPKYPYKYEYEKNTGLNEMPVIKDCVKYKDGTSKCVRKVGYDPDEFNF